jgi:hypothetical protein
MALKPTFQSIRPDCESLAFLLCVAFQQTAVRRIFVNQAGPVAYKFGGSKKENYDNGHHEVAKDE